MYLFGRLAPWLWIGARFRLRRWVLIGAVAGLAIVLWGLTGKQ